ncbi:Hydrogenase 3 component D [Raoultella planticola]|uniref:Hydrogenase 3 component D n=1 Tax=Raoultella planticola TaxID=575 RepID=A0A485C7J5_RAOPL|nr:Hydrogenase 3 component D [Raoultella planticola]
MLGVLVEPILLLGLWVAAQVAGSTHISRIAATIYHWPAAHSVPLVLALCACAFATFYRNGQAAVRPGGSGAGAAGRAADRIQRQRLCGTEMGISLKQLVVLQMFVGVFIPWGAMTSFSLGGLLLALVAAIVKLVVGVLVIALFENSMARLRFCATSRVTWGRFWLCVFSFRLLAGGVIKRV